MSLSLPVDDRLVERARDLARQQGTSLNALIRDYIERLAGVGLQLNRLDVVLIRPELILGAIDLCRLHLSFWDALVVRSASAAACGRLLSEDMQNGQMITGSGSRTRS